ncbi:MAG: ComEC/Rec2 family competence protein [Sneathiella sp.]|nr:ComEC/Rec2 family competence protein [Sneathiella sp.]
MTEIGFSAKKQKLILTNIDLKAENAPALKKIRLTVRTGASHIKPGQTIGLKAVLLPPPPPAYPGAYDFQRDLYFKGIGAVGYAISKPEILNERRSFGTYISSLISRTRHQINKIVTELAPEKTSGFSIAIMTGERTSLTKKTVTHMRKSGLAHLLAISGLHMGLVGGIIFFGARFLASLFPAIALHYSVKKWAAVLAMVGITGYLLVSGMPVSALRAYLMISMVFCAICFDRSALSLRNLALAAALLLLVLPESLNGASFQMSFSAVFCLIAAYERFGLRFMVAANSGGMAKRLTYYLAGVAFTSVIASLATAPFAIYHFGSVAALGILANLVAVPVMGFWVMPWTLLSLIPMPAGLSEIPLWVAGKGIWVILEVAAYVTNFPHHRCK